MLLFFCSQANRLPKIQNSILYDDYYFLELHDMSPGRQNQAKKKNKIETKKQKLHKCLFQCLRKKNQSVFNQK